MKKFAMLILLALAALPIVGCSGNSSTAGGTNNNAALNPSNAAALNSSNAAKTGANVVNSGVNTGNK